VGVVGRSFSGAAGSCRRARRCATTGNHLVGRKLDSRQPVKRRNLDFRRYVTQ
jgi:hypothetical protein